ncbi:MULTISPECIES: 3-oxoadipyl-CoA thiolase [unclassified Ensifer]|uniref:3-oxoadipyl-CoA thiolase n=1 Tax=unclassified Ensifer TaxID=2633371 RepID=UPI000813A559|nr:MULTISPECIES: 3-oxoadipyl-CoA thiolase [unclassified Ensifer]OCP15023.1 3-oxoadipyl-CoA thiolase [Ensifer sp. LC163]OCP19328.1 3-oxoadipyl-CoA thiolase [Ensifer sp. LC54]OCP19354.1 3-oxoadipyl-CoA thiolase [Ensifer sp. LC384]
MSEAYVIGGVRTPIGRYGGALSAARPDDLAAHAIREALARFPSVPAERIDEVVLGCANQAGEDNRNVARMASLLAGLPDTVPGTTINRLCGSGLDAVGYAARAIRLGEAEIVIAGGVESMSRAPFVMPKAGSAFQRSAEIYDTTIGWRFVNPLMEKRYGIDSMPETAENVATEFSVSRDDQDGFALRSQARAAAAQKKGRFAREIAPYPIKGRKGETTLVEQDEHPRETTIEKLASLPTPFRANGTVTAGNASGVNDGAAALILASGYAVERYDLRPLAKVSGVATAGVAPRIMGIGPVFSTRKLLDRHRLGIGDIDIFELNEAFAAQSLACMRQLGLADDAARVNPNGGAIALGHPLGMSGARLALTAALELELRDGRHAIATMCIGVGQGISLLLTRP